ncbi:hypothetical protein [Pseudomonas mangrovi]|uniref:Uncharacterized protein n=1 Tax=Pseudomonas mangrovi TaxID=2161748 RepID=A0A2T5PCL3_9PSED|nr:hypothetical protein [Pseudomonas mangrovi]PTU75488.1 hypothetical protein DBO85_04935 [Pseudomonas mangrovi]
MTLCGAEQSFERARLFPLQRERVPKAGEGCLGQLVAHLPLLVVRDGSLLADASIKTPLTDTSDDLLLSAPGNSLPDRHKQKDRPRAVQTDDGDGRYVASVL